MISFECPHSKDGLKEEKIKSTADEWNYTSGTKFPAFNRFDYVLLKSIEATIETCKGCSIDVIYYTVV